MTEQTKETQTQQTQGTEEPLIPKSRLDQQTQKTNEEASQKREAQAQVKKLKDQQEQQDAEREQSQGEWKKTAEREQKKREKAEEERDKAAQDLVTYKTRGAFSKAARGIIRSDAIDDAYLFLTKDELASLKDSDPDRYEAAARRLAESRPYLADGQRASGSGGSQRPATPAEVKKSAADSPLRKGQKRRIY